MFVAYKFKPHAECYLRNESVMFFIESSTALTTISQEKREVRGQLQDQAVQKTLRRQTVSGALNHKSTVGHLSTLISISLRHTFLTVALWFLIPDTLSESLRESHASLSEAKSALEHFGMFSWVFRTNKGEHEGKFNASCFGLLLQTSIIYKRSKKISACNAAQTP